MRFRLLAGSASTLASVAILAASATACGSHSVPFSGSYSGDMKVTAGNANGPTQATYSGTGQATHLGRSHLDGVVNITGPAVKCQGFDASHTETLRAANGDKLYVSETEESCTTDGATFDCTGTYSITGGTGRFRDARGNGKWTGHLAFDPTAGTGTFATSYSGALVD